MTQLGSDFVGFLCDYFVVKCRNDNGDVLEVHRRITKYWQNELNYLVRLLFVVCSLSSASCFHLAINELNK